MDSNLDHTKRLKAVKILLMLALLRRLEICLQRQLFKFIAGTLSYDCIRYALLLSHTA